MKTAKISLALLQFAVVLLFPGHANAASDNTVHYSEELTSCMYELFSVAQLDLAAWANERPIAIVRVRCDENSGREVVIWDPKGDRRIKNYSVRCEVLDLLSGELETRKWTQEGDANLPDFQRFHEINPYLNWRLKGADEHCYATKVNLEKKDCDRLTVLCIVPESLIKDFTAAFATIRDVGDAYRPNGDSLAAEPNTFLALREFGRLLREGDYRRCISEVMNAKTFFRQAAFAYMCSSDRVLKYDAKNDRIGALMARLDAALRDVKNPEFKAVEGIAAGILAAREFNTVRQSFFGTTKPLETIATLSRRLGSHESTVSGLSDILRRFDPEDRRNSLEKPKQKDADKPF